MALVTTHPLLKRKGTCRCGVLGLGGTQEHNGYSWRNDEMALAPPDALDFHRCIAMRYTSQSCDDNADDVAFTIAPPLL